MAETNLEDKKIRIIYSKNETDKYEHENDFQNKIKSVFLIFGSYHEISFIFFFVLLIFGYSHETCKYSQLIYLLFFGAGFHFICGFFNFLTFFYLIKIVNVLKIYLILKIFMLIRFLFGFLIEIFLMIEYNKKNECSRPINLLCYFYAIVEGVFLLSIFLGLYDLLIKQPRSLKKKNETLFLSGSE